MNSNPHRSDDILDLPEAPPIMGLWDLFSWWEKKRRPYNKIVGGIGLIPTSMGLILSLATKDGASAQLILIIAVIYAILANLCFFLGFIVESILWWANVYVQDRAHAQFLYKAGLYFSVAITAVIGFLFFILSLMVIG